MRGLRVGFRFDCILVLADRRLLFAREASPRGTERVGGSGFLICVIYVVVRCVGEEEEGTYETDRLSEHHTSSRALFCSSFAFPSLPFLLFVVTLSMAT